MTTTRVGILALLLSAACAPVLGIDEAHVDPSLARAADAGAHESGTPDAGAGSEGGNCGSPLTPPSTFACTICKPFDNAKRLNNLLPDGGLLPLPAAP
jgi:hypothetical protein